METVAEIGECTFPSVRRKTSLPCDTTDLQSPILSRIRFKSYPTDCNIPTPLAQLSSLQTSPEFNTLKNNDTCGEKHTDNAEDADLECLDPEAKEFNGDFYTICSIGSNKSLDHLSPSKTRDMTLKQLMESPVFNRKSPLKNVSKALPTKSDKLKPTGLVKPTRPFTLAVNSVPRIPGHKRLKSKSDVPSPSDKSEQKPETCSTTKVPCPTGPGDIHAKTNLCSKVPLKNLSVFQNDADHCLSNSTSNSLGESSPSNGASSPSSLPASMASDSAVAVKAKSPTKIIFRNRSPSKQEDSAKRHQLKKDRVVARQNRLKEGCGTAWIHLQADPSLSDPSVICLKVFN